MRGQLEGQVEALAMQAKAAQADAEAARSAANDLERRLHTAATDLLGALQVQSHVLHD